MTTLTKPDFRLTEPNTNPFVPDPLWWLWLVMKLFVGADLQLGGIYANKSGFHNTRRANSKNWPNNYSIRDVINQSGDADLAAGIDLTFISAQRGDYTNINIYTKRLVHSALDPNDPRLDMYVFEFYGQADTDTHVEGYDEYHEREVTSDSSHLWHIHISAIRSKVESYWGAWALYTVLIGWTTAQWRASLPEAPPVVQPPVKPVTGISSLPPHINGAHEVKEGHRGTDVLYIQKFIGPRAGTADGVFGADTKAGVIWYQKMRGLTADGIVGPKTWKALGY